MIKGSNVWLPYTSGSITREGKRNNKKKNSLGSGTSVGCDGERRGCWDFRLSEPSTAHLPLQNGPLGFKSRQKQYNWGFIKMVWVAFLLKFLTHGWWIRISVIPWLALPLLHCHRPLSYFVLGSLSRPGHHFLCILHFLSISAYTFHTQTWHMALHFVDTQETFVGGDFTETV